MKITFGDSTTNIRKQALRDEIKPAERKSRDFLETYLDFTKNQESTKKIHQWVATSIIAGALERKVWLNMGHFKIYPNLYLIIIGESGSIRKSTSTGIGVGLLREIESINIMSEMLTQASLIEQLGRSGVTFEIGQEDYRQSSTYCYASELIVFLKEVSGTISELLTTFYDCQEKPWIKELKSGTTVIHGPCLNILGASTPTWLQRAIPGDEMEGGFSSRVIFVVERNSAENLIAWPESQKNSKELREALVSDLTQIHGLKGEFQKTKAARDFYEDWYIAFRKAPVSDDPRFKGYFARKPITVLKLAMIYAAAQSGRLLLEQEHIERGIYALNQIEPDMIHAFGSSGRNDLAKTMGDIMIYMARKKSASQGNILGAFHRDVSGKDLGLILDDLVKMKELRIKQVNSEFLYFHKNALDC
jgi:hypothetical protein